MMGANGAERATHQTAALTVATGVVISRALDNKQKIANRLVVDAKLLAFVTVRHL